MAVRAERAAVQGRNVGRNQFMIATRESTVAKTDQHHFRANDIAHIGTQAQAPHDERGACFFVKFCHLTTCVFRLNPLHEWKHRVSPSSTTCSLFRYL